MNNKFFCRLFQFIMKIGMYFLPWRKPELIKGENAVSKIPELLKQKNISSVLIVTDMGITNRDLHISLVNALSKNNISYAIYDDTVPNPTINNIEEAVKIYNNFNAQGLIAMGGGSAMDCCKGVGARIAKPKKTISQMRGILKVRKKLPLLIAIPTTAGTGSETTLAAVITDSNTHEKYAINDISLIPRYAVLDPTLTISLPPMLTATTGLDALTHAVEAFIGNSNTKETKKNAINATKLIFKYLPTAVENGNNLQARENMQEASFMAGVAFTRAYVGNIHSIAHTLGGQYGVPHGLANAIIMPYVLEYYGKSIYKKIANLCKSAELFGDNRTDEEYTQLFINELKNMNKEFGIPDKIEQLKEEDISILAKRASRESNPLYPVPKIFNLKDFENIYKMLLVK